MTFTWLKCFGTLCLVHDSSSLLNRKGRSAPRGVEGIIRERAQRLCSYCSPTGADSLGKGSRNARHSDSHPGLCQAVLRFIKSIQEVNPGIRLLHRRMDLENRWGQETEAVFIVEKMDSWLGRCLEQRPWF